MLNRYAFTGTYFHKQSEIVLFSQISILNHRKDERSRKERPHIRIGKKPEEQIIGMDHEEHKKLSVCPPLCYATRSFSGGSLLCADLTTFSRPNKRKSGAQVLLHPTRSATKGRNERAEQKKSGA